MGEGEQAVAAKSLIQNKASLEPNHYKSPTETTESRKIEVLAGGVVSGAPAHGECPGPQHLLPPPAGFPVGRGRAGRAVEMSDTGELSVDLR